MKTGAAQRRTRLQWAIGLTALLALPPALAHSTVDDAGLMAGLMHPVSGADHLLAMLAVGVVSVRMGGDSIWKVPAAFVVAMVFGACLGVDTGPWLFGEWLIACSVVVLGLCIAWPKAIERPRIVFAGVLLFGCAHGFAHGVELPHAASPLFYAMGFLITTVFVHVLGILVGALAGMPSGRSRLLDGLGWLMAGAGIWFLWC